MKKIQAVIATLCAVVILSVAGSVSAASIGNVVWNDHNGNGIQDAGEEGISGVKVKLYNGNDVETDRTNSEGRYKFKDLDAGHYTIIVAQETLPEGCYNTYDRNGGHDGKYADKYLQKNDSYTHADFGYQCTSKTKYIAAGTMSPKTGTSTAVAIIALAFAAGIAMVVYKKQSEKKALKK